MSNIYLIDFSGDDLKYWLHICAANAYEFPAIILTVGLNKVKSSLQQFHSFCAPKEIICYDLWPKRFIFKKVKLIIPCKTTKLCLKIAKIATSGTTH